MKINVSNLRMNPFRDVERYPINPAKVEALVESIKSTSFWDNLVARPSKKDEIYELAYGHHRLQALKKLRISEINIPVRPLDDATMLKMMANENMEEWGANAGVLQETIRAVVLAYADGKIELPRPPKDTSKNIIRYAPDFAIESDNGRIRGYEHPYTAETIARFLSWPVLRVKSLLDLLSLEEDKIIKPSMVQGLTISAVQAIVKNANRFSEKPEIAKAVARELSDDLRSGNLIATHDTRRREEVNGRASMIAARHGYEEDIDKKKPKQLPDQDRATMRLADDMAEFTPAMMQRCKQIIEVAKFVGEKPKVALAKAIRKHAALWLTMADKLEK